MTIETPRDLDGLLAIGRIIRLTLDYMREQIRPGLTTGELDLLAGEFMRKHGARSAPKLTYNYPGHTCISINEEAAHGLPGQRVIQAGDVVKIDVSAERDGFIADAATTVLVSPGSPQLQKLCACAQGALEAGIQAARAGQPINQIGRAVERVTQRHGFHVIRELHAHGVGRGLHEAPQNIPQYYAPHATQRLTEGLVITVEPHVSTRAGRIAENANGWTLSTRAGSYVAQFEHTIVITKGRPLIVTA